MEEIYKENAQIVYYFILKRCHNRNLAEDITQETFLKAIESISKYNGSCKLSTWLCQIALHLLYQHNQKECSNEYLELDDNLKAHENTEESAFANQELKLMVNRLSYLPELNQKVFRLKMVSDLTFAEIGSLCMITENHARVLYYRTKKTLKEEINEL